LLCQGGGPAAADVDEGKAGGDMSSAKAKGGKAKPKPKPKHEDGEGIGDEDGDDGEFAIENAKSSRSACKSCGEKITKGEVGDCSLHLFLCKVFCMLNSGFRVWE